MYEATSDDFDRVVAGGRVLVYMTSPNCGPCRAARPILEKFEEDHGDEVKVVKVDVVDCPDLAQKFAVHAVPTFIGLENGYEVRRYVGGRISRVKLLDVSGLES